MKSAIQIYKIQRFYIFLKNAIKKVKQWAIEIEIEEIDVINTLTGKGRIQIEINSDILLHFTADVKRIAIINRV